MQLPSALQSHLGDNGYLSHYLPQLKTQQPVTGKPFEHLIKRFFRFPTTCMLYNSDYHQWMDSSIFNYYGTMQHNSSPRVSLWPIPHFRVPHATVTLQGTITPLTTKQSRSLESLCINTRQQGAGCLYANTLKGLVIAQQDTLTLFISPNGDDPIAPIPHLPDRHPLLEMNASYAQSNTRPFIRFKIQQL